MFNFFTKKDKKYTKKNGIIFCINENDDLILNKIFPKNSKIGNYALYSYDQLHDLFAKKSFAKEMKNAKYVVFFIGNPSAYQDIALQYAVNCAKKNDVTIVPYPEKPESSLSSVRGLDFSKLKVDGAVAGVMNSLLSDIENFKQLSETSQLSISEKHQKLLISNVSLALFNLFNNNFNMTISCLQNADNCFEKLETVGQNLTKRAELNSFLSKTYLSKNMPKSALVASDIQIACMEKARYQLSYKLMGEYATALIENGDINLQLGAPKKAENVFLSAYKLLEQASHSTSANDQKLALLDAKLGNLYFDAKKFKPALAHYQKCLQFEKTNNLFKQLIDVEQIESQVEICKSEIDKKQMQNKTKKQMQTQTTSEENDLCL